MRVSVAGGSPNEFIGFFEEGEFVVKIDPCAARLRQCGAGLAGRNVREKKLQLTLVAALALDRHSLAVG